MKVLGSILVAALYLAKLVFLGPFLAVLIGLVSVQGLAAVPFLLLGRAAVEGATVLGLRQGLARYLEKSLVKAVRGIVEGSFLLWLGWKITAMAGTATAAHPFSTSVFPARGRRSSGPPAARS